MTHDNAVLEQAVDWAVRAHDPSFTDWDDLTVWLESAPAHAAAYAFVTAQAATGEAALRTLPQPVNDDGRHAAPAPKRRSRWLGGAVATAATLAAIIGVWQTQGGAYSVETAPGQQRTVQLKGGGSIELAGGTRILLDRHDPHVATLDQGQATFIIRHDEKHPFRVAVGDDTLVDVGTVFDVRHISGNTTVAVSEGAVMFNPKLQNVRIDPGRQLTSHAGSAAYRISDIMPSEVGEWREGRLTFADASLADVAGDLSRLSGLDFEAAPEAAARRVSGSLVIGPIRKDPRALGPLLGVGIRSAGQKWVIGAQ